MFTLIKSVYASCGNCEHVGPSIVNKYYRWICGSLLLVVVPVGVIAIMGFRSVINVDGRLTELALFPFLAISGLFFSPNAHSCEKCGSDHLREIELPE